MSYVIMKLIKGGVPIKWKKVCCIANIFPKNGFLKTKYGLSDEDRISVRHTKRSNSKFKMKGYRTAFKHIYNGTVKGFEEFSRKWYQKNVWK